MNIRELKTHDPKRFEKEYVKWCEHAFYPEWWDYIEEQFKAECEPMGIHIGEIRFSVSYCQSDYASFTGFVNMAEWMQHKGHDQQYLALWLDMQEFGARVALVHNRNTISYSSLDYSPGNCTASGVFSGLPDADWDELCVEQLAAEDWGDLVMDHVRELEHELYKRLRDEYEYMTSEEQFIEYCESSDVTFDTDEV